jgi:hypothetical protein
VGEASRVRNGIVRWYDPIAGRWLSNDPIGVSGGLNQYAFCANNAANFVDPVGLLFGRGQLLGVGGPVDRALTTLTCIDESTYGIERAIALNRGLSDPGPIVGRDRTGGFGMFGPLGASVALTEHMVVSCAGRYMYGILSIRSGIGWGWRLPGTPRFPKLSASGAAASRMPPDTQESWRAEISGHAIYGGAVGVQYDNLMWGSPSAYGRQEFGLIDISATATYGTSTVIYNRHLGSQ